MLRRPPTIEIVYFDAGGGHRNAAFALRDSIDAADFGWRVELVQLQTVLQSRDPVYKLMGFPSEDIYNAAVKRGWTYGSRPFLRMLQQGIALEAPALKRLLQRWWIERSPEMVVSLVPNFNRILFEALHCVHPDVPFVTVMTDLIDSPPRFWMERQDQFMICGTRKATLQALLSGYYRPERIFQVSGMMIKPSFYAQKAAPTDTMTRDHLGLAPQAKVAIVSYGGNGSDESIEVVRRIRKLDVSCIVLCGRNEKLLQRLQGTAGVHPVAFTDRVADYMRLADMFVGKPGPGSISEALVMGLPVVVSINGRTMVQERYNITWAEEQGVGIGFADYDQLQAAIRHLLTGANLAEYKARAAAIDNRAVFEVPRALATILQEIRQSVR